MMTFHRLHAVTPGITPVSVHLEGDMLGNWALFEGADEQLSKLLEGPFARRRLKD